MQPAYPILGRRRRSTEIRFLISQRIESILEVREYCRSQNLTLQDKAKRFLSLLSVSLVSCHWLIKIQPPATNDDEQSWTEQKGPAPEPHCSRQRWWHEPRSFPWDDPTVFPRFVAPYPFFFFFSFQWWSWMRKRVFKPRSNWKLP